MRNRSQLMSRQNSSSQQTIEENVQLGGNLPRLGQRLSCCAARGRWGVNVFHWGRAHWLTGGKLHGVLENVCQRKPLGARAITQISERGCRVRCSPRLSGELCWRDWTVSYGWTSSTSPVAVEAVSGALSASWSPPSWSWLRPGSCPCT